MVINYAEIYSTRLGSHKLVTNYKIKIKKLKHNIFYEK
jgi:hypothetical protein